MRYKKYVLIKNIRHQQNEYDNDQRYLRIDQHTHANPDYCFYHFIEGTSSILEIMNLRHIEPFSIETGLEIDFQIPKKSRTYFLPNKQLVLLLGGCFHKQIYSYHVVRKEFRYLSDFVCQHSRHSFAVI